MTLGDLERRTQGTHPTDVDTYARTDSDQNRNGNLRVEEGFISGQSCDPSQLALAPELLSFRVALRYVHTL